MQSLVYVLLWLSPLQCADNIFLLKDNENDVSAYSQHKITCLQEKYILHQIYDSIQLEVALHLQVHYNSLLFPINVHVLSSGRLYSHVRCVLSREILQNALSK